MFVSIVENMSATRRNFSQMAAPADGAIPFPIGGTCRIMSSERRTEELS